MPPYEDQTAKQVTEVPPWERAHRTLDQLTDEMRSRAAEIKDQMARLAGERDAIISVLGRIAPPQSPHPTSAPPNYGVAANATPASYRY